MNQDQIGILIKRASLDVEKTALAILAPYSMNLTQYKIIVYLYDAPPASTRQVDLERAFSMTNPSVTSVLHTLEKKGLIQREENPADRRSNVISLTDKAIRLQSELETVGERLEEAIAENLSPEERTALIALLKKCCKTNITQEPSATKDENRLVVWRGIMRRTVQGRFFFAAKSALNKLAICSPVEPQIVPA